MNAQTFITEANKQQVCCLLGWSNLEYASFQEQKGIEYLQALVGTDAWGIDHLTKCSLFWKWWINHWNSRDAEFLTYAPGSTLSFRVNMYMSLNKAEGFEFYPHRVIMEQSYAILVGDINKQNVKRQASRV